MDHNLFLCILLLILSVFVLKIIIKSVIFWNSFKNVPGPFPRLPILGNILIFIRPQIPKSQLLYKIIGELAEKYRKHGMFALFIGTKLNLFLFEPQYVLEFLRNKRLIDKPPEYSILSAWLGNGLVTANGNQWKSKRKLLTRVFHSQIIEEYIPIMNEVCSNLITTLDEATTKSFIDVKPLMSETTLEIILMTAMGVSLEMESVEVKEYRKCLEKIPSLIISRYYDPLNWYDFIFYRRNAGKKLLSDIKSIHNFTENIIQRRKSELKSELIKREGRRISFLDLLLTLQTDNDSITDEEIRDEVNTFMFAGHDSSSTCLTWTLFLLGRHPQCQQKLIEEINSIFGDDSQRDVNKNDISRMNYTECVIKESLRLYPPAHAFGRVTNSDVVIGGHSFPKGTTVVVSVRDLNRNEKKFSNPLTFLPERFENQNGIQLGFMPFAIGPRNCIGQQFSLTEMKIILAHIFRNFRITSLDDESSLRITTDLIMKPMNPIRISFQKISCSI